jgi:anti-sigma regulatory factor (Ser/Thr protein kinase)
LEDLSLHILDISENSIVAGASLVDISVNENTRENVLLLEIRDNGAGLDEEARQKALDPFYTTKGIRSVGLGLPMLAQAAREAGGELSLRSEEGKGTTVSARFVLDHIDRKPLGNIAETLVTLIAAKGGKMDFLYRHVRNGREFFLDTREVKAELKDVPITAPGVLKYLKEAVNNGLKDLLKE